ncbi:TrmH family RNA methyltransferase [Lewinella sp. W8]|uniref:TrmH family RNA methyltransferase n=1 Tax=Lewinella sp. W8 TaxID=2528208 RepID=UPI001564AF78|nr:TrmH family RNA methyltransferase [Lewinella sp. W8]
MNSFPSSTRTLIRQLTHHEIKQSRREFPIRLLCPDWQDPRNVGAAFRLSDAAGIRQLILAGDTPAPPNSRINKTARSTVRSVPYRHYPDAVAALRELRGAGHYLLALEITDQSQSIFEYSLPAAVREDQRDLVLVTGAESQGVAPDLLALCHDSIHLPMFGQNTSMNVSVATGIAVYELLRQLA